MISSVAFETGTPALLLKTGSYILHHGGVGIIRSLGRVGIPTYAVCESHWTPAARSRFLSGRFVWIAEATAPEAFLSGLHAIGDRLNSPAVLLPTDDSAAIFIAENSQSLRNSFLLPQPPVALPRALADKKTLHFLCKALGHPTPAAYFPQSTADLAVFQDQKSYPLMVKRAQPWVPLHSPIAGTTIVRTPDELDRLFRLAQALQVELLIQEYLPDTSSQDWFFHGYCDATSNCVVSFTGRKFRSFPPRAGFTTFAQAIDNDRLRTQAEALLRQISYRGIMDLDYRYDARDGLYKLVDFNPRVGAQFRLFEDHRGIDVVRAQHLDLTGRRAAPTGRMVERSFVVELHDVPSSFSYIRSGDISLWRWLQSVLTADEYAWLATDDLLPFALLVVWILRRTVRRLFAKRPAARAGHGPVYKPGRASRRLKA